MRRTVEKHEIEGPAGTLEALLTVPEGAHGVAVVCHPHPLYGGTMNNNVCYHAALGLAETGRATLRFNFRGVGASGGSYDEGRGEQDDLRAALAWLDGWARGEGLDPTPVVGGFSFGSRVAIGVAAGLEPTGLAALVAIGIAPRLFDLSGLLRVTAPTLVVQGDADEYGPLADVHALLVDAPRVELHVIEGAAHFFEDRHSALRTVVREWTERAVPRATPS